MTDKSCTNELFGTPKIQQPGESGNATDTQGDALETLSMEDLNQDPGPEVGVSDGYGGECIAPELVTHKFVCVDAAGYRCLYSKGGTLKRSMKI